MAFGLLLTVVSLTSFVGTVLSDPGVIPRMEDPRELFDEVTRSHRKGSLPKNTQMVVGGQLLPAKFCTTCNIYRPPRCSHCAYCDNCVEKFDHHCPWVGNCIGRRNYRLFFCFVVSSASLTLYVCSFSVAHLWLRVIDKTSDGSTPGSVLLDVLAEEWASAVAVAFTIAVCWFTCGLCGYHSYLIGSNQTTYEQIRGDGWRANPFNVGLAQNVMQALCIPVRYSFLDTLAKAVRRPRTSSVLVEPGFSKPRQYLHTGVAIGEECPVADPSSGYVVIGEPVRPPVVDSDSSPTPDGTGVGSLHTP